MLDYNSIKGNELDNLNRTVKTSCVALFFLSMILALAPATSKALPPATWTPGSEAALFGHTFDEEFWTNGSIPIVTPNGTANFMASYVNYSSSVGSFQAMLVALGMVNLDNGLNCTLPYQLFGLHFTTPSSRDIFVGALLAFLYAWNDSIDNGYPDGSENKWFLLPYGVDNGTSTLQINAIPATKVDTGHYRFGVTYRNLYLRVVDTANWGSFLVTLMLPWLTFTISEFTVTYDIQVNTTSGEITAETFYTIGQIQDAYLLGVIPIPDPLQYLGGIGIGAAHFSVIFASDYDTQLPGGTTPTNATNWDFANVTADGSRAFAIGTRGTYDVLNETGGLPYTTINSSLPAYVGAVTANPFSPIDRLLVGWQLPLSADIFSVFAYAMSSDLQSQFTGPLDLYLNATTTFGAFPFWYTVGFPEFNGYRIVHDPTYTAYSNIIQTGTTEPPPPIPGFPLEAVGIGLAASLGAVFLVRRRRRRR
jgi:hypothetical protein